MGGECRKNTEIQRVSSSKLSDCGLCHPRIRMGRSFVPCSSMPLGHDVNEKDVVFAAATMWRSINLMLVDKHARPKNKVASIIDAPFDKALFTGDEENDLENEIREGHTTVVQSSHLWRGGMLPRTHRKWFEEHKNKLVRSRQATATSPDRSTATEFMLDNAYADGEEADVDHVMFKFCLKKNTEPTEPVCMHVAALNFLSHVDYEEEYLFPPFSVFQIGAVRDQVFDDEQRSWRPGDADTKYVEISILVMQDNQNFAEDRRVPLIPWM